MALFQMVRRVAKGSLHKAKACLQVTSHPVIITRHVVSSRDEPSKKEFVKEEEEEQQFQGLQAEFPCLAQEKESAERIMRENSETGAVKVDPKLPDSYGDYLFKMPHFEPTSQFRGMTTNFPCIASHDIAGPEPDYENVSSGFRTYTVRAPLHLKYRHGVLPEVTIAYETWGELNERRDNAVLISTGLSASSHVRSHADNPNAGWWERFVGPGCAIDTDKFFVICSNNLGGCYGSTGPSSINPITGKPYGTTFPLVSLDDMVNVQFKLLDHLGIDKLYATVGASLGGMLSVADAIFHPDRVSRVVTISACLQSHPTSIAMRYLQRKAIMLDPFWQSGQYYGTGKYPVTGMKLARELATLAYRSGVEWEERFGRSKINDEEPSLCPVFMIENYLDYQGESFCMKMDPNTLIYLSKAMDLFDLRDNFASTLEAVSHIKCPVLVMGATTDLLFPIRQQREISTLLHESGNDSVTYFELDSVYGHDTFLLELNTVGTGIKGFLETNMKERGRARKRTDKKSY